VSATAPEVLDFARQFRDGVIARARGLLGADREDDVAFREEAFTELFIDALAETGAVSEGHVCHFERRVGHSNARVDGYYHDEEEDDRLDLFVSIFEGGDEPPAVSRDQVSRAVQQVLSFVKAATDGVHKHLEPSDEAHGMLQRVHELRAQIREIRVFVLTDGFAKEFKSSKGIKLPGKVVTVHVWDIERLSRCVSTGGAREPIEVDFVADFGKPIPCLPVAVDGARYRSYLAVIPGEVLHKLYDEYGERLLELNVRSFLQARGKINKEIRRTILEEPEQFFAFNNGLTAIAEEVRTRPMDGGTGIAWVKGLQIVNGGQTTASLHRAGKKDDAGSKLKTIQVQAKLSVIAADLLEDMVPRISLYANSQNKVNDADFSANDPFHRQLERLSRSIWTPDGQTHWFYERARGQYQVARTREGRTAAALKKFDAINPSNQMFSKTDLAMFAHSWEGLPHIVSRGSQKNFREFTLRLSQRKQAIEPDEMFFREFVGKAILFKHTQAAARAAQVGAYRANIVTYVVAYLAARFRDAIDLRQIWERQSVPAALDYAIRALLAPVGELIVRGAGTRNVTEYCKREECWTLISSQELAAGAAPTKPQRSAPKTPTASAEEAALAIAASLGIEAVDNSQRGGPIWLIADQTRTDLVDLLEKAGIRPQFAPGGGRATDHRPAWFIKV
jgi:hypothetical protein